MNYIKSQSFDVIHISTPGPMGLLGLLAAHTLRVPVCGTYHTDFPRYATQLTGDPALADVAWSYMRWFYGQMDLIAAPSSSTRTELIRHGLDERAISVVGRGVDLAAFSPAHRDDSLRRSWGPARHKLLYVGRLSAEKNVYGLAEAFKLLATARADVELIIAGEGPARTDLQNALAGLPVRFTGMKKGGDLAAIYASCDLFLFASETDTFGRVVLEAQASGLPVIVSSAGGPKDVVAHGTSGIVIECITPDKLFRTVSDLLDNPVRCHVMRLAAREQARSHTPDASFNAFWALNRASCPDLCSGSSAQAST
jgi:glycosyltransferase involved in cell wall biosynthesis